MLLVCKRAWSGFRWYVSSVARSCRCCGWCELNHTVRVRSETNAADDGNGMLLLQADDDDDEDAVAQIKCT